MSIVLKQKKNVKGLHFGFFFSYIDLILSLPSVFTKRSITDCGFSFKKCMPKSFSGLFEEAGTH